MSPRSDLGHGDLLYIGQNHQGACSLVSRQSRGKDTLSGPCHENKEHSRPLKPSRRSWLSLHTQATRIKDSLPPSPQSYGQIRRHMGQGSFGTSLYTYFNTNCAINSNETLGLEGLGTHWYCQKPSDWRVIEQYYQSLIRNHHRHLL